MQSIINRLHNPRSYLTFRTAGRTGGAPGNRDEEQRWYNVIIDPYERLMERYYSLVFR